MTERLSDERLRAIFAAAKVGARIFDSREIESLLRELLELRAKLSEWPWPLNAGLSWSGFGISGDEKSIAEVKRLISVDARSEDLQKIVLEQRAKLAAGPVMPEVPQSELVLDALSRVMSWERAIEMYADIRTALLKEQSR